MEYLHNRIIFYTKKGTKMNYRPARKNDLDLGLPVLRRVMDGADYERLGFTDNCGALHEAALACERPEF